MKKDIKCLVFLVLFLVPALFSQIFAMEDTPKHSQMSEEKVISKYTNVAGGWTEDGRDERGGIRFKDTAGDIHVSFEHLDPQNAKPSPESTLWLFPQFIRHYGDKKSSFYYWVVSPLGTHGLIYGSFFCTQTERRFGLSWVPYGSPYWIEESSLARAFDLAIDCFSEDKNMDFKDIIIIADPSYLLLCASSLKEITAIASASSLLLCASSQPTFSVLRSALYSLRLYEKINKGPAPYSIEEKFYYFKGAPMSEIENNLPWYILIRRVKPLANPTNEGLRDSNAALGSRVHVKKS